MPPLFQSVADVVADSEILRNRRYGVIEAAEGEFCRVRLRPFPSLALAPEMLLLGRCYHRYHRGDRCLLYYNQPFRFPNFLAVRYLVSGRATSLRTISRALDVLEEVARLKRTDALLCDVANSRISSGLMTRLGWEPHCPSRWHRHFIKRFYGDYPPKAEWIGASQLTVRPGTV
jgi:hypothetical protein